MKTKSPTTPAKSSSRQKDRSEGVTLEWAFAVAKVAIDKKAENIRVLDLSKISGFTDYFVICSAMNERQIQAIADAVSQRMKVEDVPTLSVEGYAEGRWVLIDLGDIVVHLFLDAIREYYNIESLWSDAPKVALPSELFSSSTDHLN